MTIVCITRFVYRKGIDLLIAALPKVCALHSDVQFLIGAPLVLRHEPLPHPAVLVEASLTDDSPLGRWGWS